MKRFLTSIAAFIPFCMAVYIILLILYGEYGQKLQQKNLDYRIGWYGYTYTRMRNVADYKGVDILFVGSSHAYRGFDTRIFAEHELRTFNLGSISQTPLQTDVLLQRYLDVLRPKVVIYEVYPVLFASDGVESSLDIIANDVIDRGTIQMAIKQNNVKVYNTLLYALYRKLVQRDANFEEPRANRTSKYIDGGFVEKKLRYFKPTELPNRTLQFHEQQFAALKDALSFLRKRNIEYILVQAPITHAQYALVANKDDFDKRMEQYGPYYNFNELLDFDDTLHFYNADHLNQRGVQLFDTALIQLLHLAKE